MMSLEYVWLDGTTPEPCFRSKVKRISPIEGALQLEDVPMWSFDGSSTQQAEGSASDCLLKPVRVYPAYEESHVNYFILCEVLSADGTVHVSNHRSAIDGDYADWWFGFEQEYVIMKKGRPYGWPASPNDFPRPQGPYYCGVGGNDVVGRDIVAEHMKACEVAGITITGTNAEVMLGQWEYQCFAKGGKNAADDLWMSRYIIHRLSEQHEMHIDMSPKPIWGDWNGNGMHTNFSNNQMREKGGEALFKEICERLGTAHESHIEVYGTDNDQRLTGLHETQHISKFSYGVSDRGASIRIPVATVQDDWKGYLEDRRPAGNANPYEVVKAIITTVGG